MIDQLHKIAEERGGKCLSDTCNNTHTIIWWECEYGHRWQATPIRVKLAKSWCPVCAGRSDRITIEDMHDTAAKRGGRCLSDAYTNNATKLTWECNVGHHWESTPNKVKSGRWCPTCFNKTRGDFRRLSIEEMHQIAADRGGRCLSESYVNTRTKLLWECSKGHHWQATPSGIKKGTWCPECYVSPLTRRKQERSE